MKKYKENIAQAVASRILKCQSKASLWLSRKTQHWNKSSKLIALALFILLFGGASLWLFINAII